MTILGIIAVTQKSHDDLITTQDQHGERLQMGNAVRYSYMESSGAHVLLDISDSVVSLRRRDTGLTQAVFDMNENTEMSVHSEHGIIIFDIRVHHMNIEEESVSIQYDLMHLDEMVGQHEFKLDWKVG